MDESCGFQTYPLKFKQMNITFSLRSVEADKASFMRMVRAKKACRDI